MILTHRLLFRLTTAFLLVALVGVVVVALLTNRATTTGFRRFLDAGAGSTWAGLQADLGALYRRQGNWDGAADMLAEAVNSGRGPGSTVLSLVDNGGQVIVASSPRRGQGQGGGQSAAALQLPVEANGRTVATLVVNSPGQGGGRAAEAFLAEVNRAIWWGGLVAIALALGLGAWLAYRLTGPLRQLTQATQDMSAGRRSQEIVVADRGELGELAQSFNQMAGSLAQAEHQRRQLFADVAHELRTPLSVLRGQLEAMLDGVFPLTVDNLAIAHEEALLLGRLVDDLRTLSLAEAGQLDLACREVDPREAVNQAAMAFGPLYEAEGVTLVIDAAGTMPSVWADGERLQQILGNLLSNALHFAPQGGGGEPIVRLSAAPEADGVRFSVVDNGPGLTPEAQAHVFDRFWRADRSRNRSDGGTGLGLAICRAIVTAHGGRIWVASQPGMETAFHFSLPVRAA
jgi:two-component system, OmpR family, sensor histidine kinase BaeS